MLNAKISELADYIETLPAAQVNMSCVAQNRSKRLYGEPAIPSLARHECGTVGCIMGHATAMIFSKIGVIIKGQELNDALQINTPVAGELFMPYGWLENRDRVGKFTKTRILAVLRHLALTGVVRWEAFDTKGMTR